MSAWCGPTARLSGLLVPLGPLAFVVVVLVDGEGRFETHGWLPWIAATAAGALTCGGSLVTRFPRRGSMLATAGLLALAATSAAPLLRSPAATLAVSLPLVAILTHVWNVAANRPAVTSRLSPACLAARGRIAAAVATATWLLSISAQAGDRPAVQAAVGAAFGLFVLLAVPWVAAECRGRPARMAAAAAVVVLSAAWVAMLWDEPRLRSAGGALLVLGALLVTRPRAASGVLGRPWWAGATDHPARLLVLTFLALSLIGALLLALPVSSSSGTGVGLVDAAFTAVSAVCVTGLIVRDTPLDFSLFGQVVILVLIQLGGLGMMSFYAAAFRLLRRRLSVRHEGALAAMMSGEHRRELYRSLKRLLLLTAAAEGIGWVVLGLRFVTHGDPPLRAAWRGLFTSVSGFCNAGFALQSDSLISYQDDAWILHAVAALIVVGGLSPMAVVGLVDALRGRRVHLQVRIVLAMTAALLIGGTVLIAAIEWGNALSSFSFADRLNHAWFQSVTLRTAGFNSIDLTVLRPTTVTLMSVWMFIGGSPGGTAGGIKTTTVAVLLLAVAGAIRGDGQALGFGRKIPDETVYRAAAITTAGALTVFLFLAAIQLTQDLPPGTALFEVFSALGTVGLTLGATARLDAAGKVIISAAMFLGRVGPLTLFIFLAGRSARWVRKLPEEPIDVG